MWLSQSLYTTFCTNLSIVTTTSSRITTPFTTHLLFHIPWLVIIISSIKNLFLAHCNNIFDLLDAAGNATLLENLILCVVAGVPLIGSCLFGVGSLSVIYGYAVMFDFMRCLGHCNVEVFSHKLFETLPILRYLIYTPTYVVDVLLTLLAKFPHVIFVILSFFLIWLDPLASQVLNKGSNFIYWIRKHKRDFVISYFKKQICQVCVSCQRCL